MITVITGQPGSGKTALCVSMLEKYKGRPIVVMGIPELQVDHQPAPPVADWVEWRTSPEDPNLSLPYFLFPENAVVVIDECQRVFRPRAAGSRVPAEVAAFETHRHTGVDFILLTQHAGLIDPNIRKLVGKHIHIRVTPFGRQLYEWTELGDPESSSSRELAARSSYRLPKKAFGLYKSAELHTKVSRKIPMYAWVFGVTLICAVVGSVVFYKRIQERINPAPIASNSLGQSKASSGTDAKHVQTPAEYVQDRKPRVEGLHHTAPAYDGLTKPVDAPWPVGCLTTSGFDKLVGKYVDRCRCIDQQGNHYETTDAICRQIVKNGIFKEWGQQETTRTAKPAGADQSAPIRETSVSLVPADNPRPTS